VGYDCISFLCLVPAFSWMRVNLWTLRVLLIRWCHGNHLKKQGVGMHLNQTHQMSLMHSSMLRCRQRHRWTAHGSWPHQLAHRTADDAPHHCAPAAAGAGRRWRAAPLRACSSGGWPQMARGTIARLQQRGLAADGARHDCAPAAAGAGRRWQGGDMPLHLLDTTVDEGAQDQMHSVSIIMMPADSLLPLKHSLYNAGLSRCDGWEGCSWE
jgi:hypothetical protein